MDAAASHVEGSRKQKHDTMKSEGYSQPKSKTF